MGYGKLTCKCLNGGVEKGFVDLEGGPGKANVCIRFPLLPLDLKHVHPAHFRIRSIHSTKVLFGCSLIGTICILVVASAEIPIAHVLQSTCSLVAIANI